MLRRQVARRWGEPQPLPASAWLFLAPLDSTALTIAATSISLQLSSNQLHSTTNTQKMLCDVCIGLLRFRKNLLLPGTHDFELATEIVPKAAWLANQTAERERETGAYREPSHFPREFFILCGHHRNADSLALAAASGCHICYSLYIQFSISDLQSITADDAVDAQDGSLSRNSSRNKTSPYEFVAYAFIFNDNGGKLDTELWIDFNYLMYPRRRPWTGRYDNRYALWPSRSTTLPSANKADQLTVTSLDSQIERPISDHTSSQMSLELAKQWLHSCVHQHTACNRDTPSIPWYPTRLLCLKTHGMSQETIRLLHTAKVLPDGPYATFSHC